ncbi:MAG TPA: MauE/DoxX family redox-associated membrane protein [Pyrinomonadaceae bacterium]|nr:MauE/DoxX family redox-associated membrane protein [Pyrinomonadaceae bacterium]
MISVLQQHQEILALFCSMFVAVLFLISGVIKLADPKRFVAVVRDFALLPDPAATFVGTLLPYVEICIAMALLLDVYKGAVLAVAIVLLASFAIAVSINLLRGRSYISCGCFGAHENSPLTWFLVGRNLLLIGIAVVGSLTSNSIGIGLFERSVMVATIGSLITAHYLYRLIVKLWQPQL